METLRFSGPPLSWRALGTRPPGWPPRPAGWGSTVWSKVGCSGEISGSEGLLWQWKSWPLFHLQPCYLSHCNFLSWCFTMRLWATVFLFNEVTGTLRRHVVLIPSDTHMPSWSCCFWWPLPDISGDALAPFYEGRSSASSQCWASKNALEHLKTSLSTPRSWGYEAQHDSWDSASEYLPMFHIICYTNLLKLFCQSFWHIWQ